MVCRSVFLCLSVTAVSCAKTADLIENRDAVWDVWTRAGPMNCVLDGVHIATAGRTVDIGMTSGYLRILSTSIQTARSHSSRALH